MWKEKVKEITIVDISKQASMEMNIDSIFDFI